MKTLLIMTLCILALYSEARPRRYHRCPFQKPQSVLSWKPIVAGGAAAGTVIAAYKISNGIEEGLQTIAEKHPETFTKTTSSIFTPLKIAMGGAIGMLLLLLFYWIFPRTIHTCKQIGKVFK